MGCKVGNAGSRAAGRGAKRWMPHTLGHSRKVTIYGWQLLGLYLFWCATAASHPILCVATHDCFEKVVMTLEHDCCEKKVVSSRIPLVLRHNSSEVRQRPPSVARGAQSRCIAGGEGGGEGVALTAAMMASSLACIEATSP